MRLSRLSAVSAFARPEEHLTRKTAHGAVVTLLGVLLASTLFCHELAWYLSGKGQSKMEVDLRRHEDLDITVDITFHAVPCAALSVDVIDASGTAESDVNNARGARLHKTRLAPSGAQLPRKDAEYSTPQSQTASQDGGSGVVNVDLGAAVKHMGEMEEEIGAHEGCRLHGGATVRRVAGRLHFAVHQQSFLDVLPQMLTGHVLPRLANMSHTVHQLSFGPSFPGQVNPLDGTARMEPEGGRGHAYKYYIKVVPTEYTTRFGTLMETSQYSVSEYASPLTGPSEEGRHDPFVDLVYDMSPIMVRVHQSPLSVLHFVVRLCAVVGGALSVTRLADSVVHGLMRASGLDAGGRGSSCGGSAGSSGGGSAQRASYGGAGGLPLSDMSLPTRSSGGGGHAGSGEARGSLQGAAGQVLGGLTTTLLRHAGGAGGALSGRARGSNGGGLPLAGGGGSGVLQMSGFAGIAPPPIIGFGSWSPLDGSGGGGGAMGKQV